MKGLNKKQIKRFIYVELMEWKVYARRRCGNNNYHYFTQQVNATKRIIKRNQ